ncbi:MAG: TonB-dependent receptor plug domain-containing protein [Fibromonadales bacterium]|nr:TonB-dependent receptor plug domain-containing protein [Fibromonadales bacterium]
MIPLLLTFLGIVTDQDFAKQDSLQVEVVETGFTIHTFFNKQFKLELPRDTVWNICAKSGELEKCYELKYFGNDSVFSAEISGKENVVWYGGADLGVESGELRVESEAGLGADSASVGQEAAEQVTELRKVVVQLRKKPRRKLGESVVSAKNIKRMPGLAEADVMRSIQALPGVVSSSDFSTKIYVRGGASDQNLFLLDNGIVYSPTHFFGLFSTFLVEAVDDVKFYKSGFPAEYGNRLSSVAAINSRKGGNDTLDEWFSKNSVKISTFATQVHTEGHQGNARWVLAARSTYIKAMLDFLKYVGATDFSVDYKFTDIQGAFDYNLGEDRDLHIAIYTGADVLNFSPLFVEWGNTAIPINFRWKINDNWKWNSGFSYSEFHQDFNIEGLLGMENGVSTLASRQSLAYSGIDKHTLGFGYDLEFSKIFFVQNIEMTGQKLEDKPKTRHHILYAQDTWRPDLWDVQYGLRLNYHELSRHFGAEPRFAASYEFAENQKLEFHTGYYLQYLNSLMFSDQESLNEFYYPARKTAVNGTVKPSSSILSAVGYSRSNIFDMLNFNVETYYKTQNNLTVYSESDLDSASAEKTESLGDLIVGGEGYSFGYELSLQKPDGFVSGSINFNQGWSVFKDGTNKAYFPNWHQPFALKSDLSVNWFEKKTYMRTSLQLKWASGMPYTPYLGYFSTYRMDESFPGYDMISLLGNRNVTMRTPYFRLDAKVIDWGKKDKWNWGITILNLTDHDNLFYIFYNTSKNPPEEQKIYQFPFFPLLMNFEYYF